MSLDSDSKNSATEAPKASVVSFRGVWGGRTESGEEIWWTEPDSRLVTSPLRRFFFYIDVRQHFLIRFFRQYLRESARAGAPPPVALDFGCGTGGMTINMSRMTGTNITGFDIYPAQIGIANQLAREANNPCEFRALNKDGSIPLADESVDLIYSADVLGHVPQIPSVLADWRRVLKKEGVVVLFTEAYYSPRDDSWAATLARDGFDMAKATPEHISLHPREALEKMFVHAGFSIEKRYAADVGHFLFFPEDYSKLLAASGQYRGIFWFSKIWERVSKLLPFYPKIFYPLRLALTYVFGPSKFGSGYFYYLRAR